MSENRQTKLRLDRLTVYLERVKSATEAGNLPQAMADVAELGEQSIRMYYFLAEHYANDCRSQTHQDP